LPCSRGRRPQHLLRGRCGSTPVRWRTPFMNKVMQRLERTSWTSMGFLTLLFIIGSQLGKCSARRPWQHMPVQKWNTDLRKHCRSLPPVPPALLQVQNLHQQDHGTALGTTVSVAWMRPMFPPMPRAPQSTSTFHHWSSASSSVWSYSRARLWSTITSYPLGAFLLLVFSMLAVCGRNQWVSRGRAKGRSASQSPASGVILRSSMVFGPRSRTRCRLTYTPCTRTSGQTSALALMAKIPCTRTTRIGDSRATGCATKTSHVIVSRSTRPTTACCGSSLGCSLAIRAVMVPTA